MSHVARCAPLRVLCRLPLLLAVVILLVASASWAAKQDSAAAKESELKAMRARIESVRRSIQADAERRDTMVGELKEADEAIQGARLSLAEVRERRQAGEQELATLNAERLETEQMIADERAALAAEVRMAYMNGRGEQLKLMLNQQDPAQLGRVLHYYGYFGRARAARIAQIEDQLQHLALLAERIDAQMAHLREIEAEHAREANNLSAARQRRARALKQLESKLENNNTRLQKMQSDARALERLVSELRRAMEEAAKAQPKPKGGKAQPAPVGRGQWPWPVKGEVLARFGQQRAGGPLRWQGMVIGAAPGTAVRAPANGRVLYSDWLPGLGLLMVLDHGNGLMSLYGHNEQLFRKVGDTVSAGEVLGDVGDTGVEGRTGIYLEIRTGKRPVDPLNWLSR